MSIKIPHWINALDNLNYLENMGYVCNVTALRKKTKMTYSYFHKLINELQNKNIVIKRKNYYSKKQDKIELTKKGKQLASLINNIKIILEQ